ncbi:hypothetical protein [Variovorax sp. RA8]|uniref:hypothetical protein n=1 Tax=Variovorax sp. (strain JCM 16519 / RA8) TaxID=662548 RepID=UPI001319A31C|nr:hypothetical protein [Variovorax sp. RA8]VTU45005.1 hypothetical protein RA8P2_00441 [Variovorax sp. RA8]
MTTTTTTPQPAFQPRPGPCRYKHSFSSLMDLEIEEVEYDDAARVVTLKADAFDSALVAEFALRDLRDAGIIVYYDETGAPRPPGARWQFMYCLAGVLYECEIALQSDRNDVHRPAARLTPRG